MTSLASDILPLVEATAPSDPAGVAQAVRRAAAEHMAVYPIGGATALGCPLPPVRPGLGVVLTGLNRIIDHAAADLTITVEAGVTLKQLDRQLAQYGQRLPVDAAHPEQATIGGLVAVDGAGPRQFGCGTIRDYVLGIRAVDGRGEEFAAGGRVVKNAAGYNLARLLVGSWGTLAVVTEVSLLVRPRPAQSAWLICQPKDFAQSERLLADLAGAQVLPVAVELLAGTGAMEGGGVGAAGSAAGAAVGGAAGGAAGGAGQGTDGLCLLVGFEGLGAEVAWMLRQLAGRWRALGVDLSQQVLAPEAERLWGRLAEFPAQIEIRVLPSQVVAVMEQLVRLDPAGAFQAHAASGVVLGRFSWTDAAALANVWREKLQPLVSQARGRMVLRRGLPGMDLRPDELWPIAGVARQVMRALRDQFDPQHILNPGRLGYETD